MELDIPYPCVKCDSVRASHCLPYWWFYGGHIWWPRLYHWSYDHIWAVYGGVVDLREASDSGRQEHCMALCGRMTHEQPLQTGIYTRTRPHRPLTPLGAQSLLLHIPPLPNGDVCITNPKTSYYQNLLQIFSYLSIDLQSSQFHPWTGKVALQVQCEMWSCACIITDGVG